MEDTFPGIPYTVETDSRGDVHMKFAGHEDRYCVISVFPSVTFPGDWHWCIETDPREYDERIRLGPKGQALFRYLSTHP